MSDPSTPNDPEPFRTVDGRGTAGFEVRGSEFRGYVAPAADVDAAESLVSRVRDRHPDATHHVPAYRVPAGGDSGMLREYHSDDGEPTGSAGKPALNVLVQRDVRNVAAVVVRHYGGTNLGVGGLARAYARAVTDAVDDAGVVETVPRERFDVTVAYDDSGTVRGLLEAADASFDATYDAEVSFAVRAPIDGAAALRDRIRSTTSGRATITREQ